MVLSFMGPGPSNNSIDSSAGLEIRGKTEKPKGLRWSNYQRDRDNLPQQDLLENQKVEEISDDQFFQQVASAPTRQQELEFSLKNENNELKNKSKFQQELIEKVQNTLIDE